MKETISKFMQSQCENCKFFTMPMEDFCESQCFPSIKLAFELGAAAMREKALKAAKRYDMYTAGTEIIDSIRKIEV